MVEPVRRDETIQGRTTMLDQGRLNVMDQAGEGNFSSEIFSKGRPSPRPPGPPPWCHRRGLERATV